MMKIQSGTDKLSDLPDPILVHILEFIELDKAVQTCVLSKRWKNLWKCLTNLTFHPTWILPKYGKFVSKVLSGRDHFVPVHTLNYMHFMDTENIGYVDCPKARLLNVVEYAVSHNVQQLAIYSPLRLTEDFKLPCSIFYCHSLTYLKLIFGYSFVCDRSKIMFPKSLNLPALKTLELCYVTFTTSENGVAEPFSTCNMLSTLVIMGCFLPDVGQTLCISNSNVSSLTIGGKADPIYKIVFSTSKLTSLTINGLSKFLAPSTFNSLFLEEGNIYYTQNLCPNEDSALISWLNLLANVKIMNLYFHTLYKIHMILKNNGSTSTQPPCFVRLESLKVELEPNLVIENVRDMVTRLLQNSPFQHGKDIITKESITFRKLQD